MNVVVTGGAGFIGSNLVGQLLNKNHRVRILDNFSSGRREFLQPYLGNSNLTIETGDLLDQNTVMEYIHSDDDIIFHLASNPDISKGINDPTLDFCQTVIATFHVLQAMRMHNVKKLFYTSGSGVYGDRGNTSIPEDTGNLEPVSMYGASKLSAEALICAFCHLFDMQAWILRPANIVGPHITHGVEYDFFGKLKKDPHRLEILGNGKQNKSYLYIDDVLDAIFLLLHKATKHINIYNIASADAITVSAIAHLVVKEMNIKNVTYVYHGGRAGWKGDVPIVRLESTKLRRLGWKPKHSSRQAIQKTVQWLIANQSSTIT